MGGRPADGQAVRWAVGPGGGSVERDGPTTRYP